MLIEMTIALAEAIVVCLTAAMGMALAMAMAGPVCLLTQRHCDAQ
jgi:hypothetical protein